MKVCTRCRVEKSKADFSKFTKAKDGLQFNCKACNKAYRDANKDRINERGKSYYQNNKDAFAAYHKSKYAERRDEMCERVRRWQIANPERTKKRKDDWVRRNADHVNKYKNDWSKARRSSDPVYYISQICRSQVYKALMAKGEKRSGKTIQYVGCSSLDLVIHIEKQFTDGMNWENRGEWHVDHIIPLATAKTLDELIPLLHFTNLRPLWGEDNLKKGDSRILLI